MINGVMHIVAAVLFAVISVGKQMDSIWLGIACAYLLTGIINLIVYALKHHKKQKTAEAEPAKEAAK